jgi:hypothetical protein
MTLFLARPEMCQEQNLLESTNLSASLSSEAEEVRRFSCFHLLMDASIPGPICYKTSCFDKMKITAQGLSPSHMWAYLL